MVVFLAACGGSEAYPSGRSGEDLTKSLFKADFVASGISAGRFHKRSGKWCSWCDYLPVCVKDDKRIKETLVRIAHIKPNP